MNPGKFHFEKLTPTNRAKLDTYAEALDFVFENNDIKNVAVTGPYGAGKSSVLESYKKGKKLSFLHISLAHFETTCEDESNPTTEGSKPNEVRLEGKILNQLLHQIPPSRIPQSHFKTKTKVSIIGTLKTSLAIFLATWLAVYFVNFYKFCERIAKGCIDSGFSDQLSIVCYYVVPISSIILAGYLIYSAIYIQNSKNFFKKIALYGNEIEILEQTDESFFDKYLNEVLYLFENAGVDVIVFEDMDRFDHNQIFEKLREINYLVNNKQSRRAVRFFYLLRDDIFTSKDRTKFFDFIIPVVPVIDNSNSYDQFVELFQKAGILSNFNQDFLRGISLYVDDMRILKNIYNEYLVYYHRIQSTELNPNKLLALIIYKNLFPKDFSDSQLNRGLVHALFASKSRLIQEEIENLQKTIESNDILIAESESEMLTSIDELDALFLKTSRLYVNNRDEGQFASHLEFVKALKAKDANVTDNYHGHNRTFNVATALAELQKNEVYTHRKNAIVHTSEDEKAKILSSTHELCTQIAILAESKLPDVLSRENIDLYFSNIHLENDLGEKDNFESVKGNYYFPLLKFLVRNGHIDEAYQDYMTYFYENSISKVDKIFLRSIMDKKAKDFSYELKSPEQIARYLGPINFDQPETLNFDLFSYLLKNRSTMQERLVRLISQIERNKHIEFLSRFFARNLETDLFVQELNRHWPGAWACISQSDFFSDQERHRFAVATLHHSADEDIVKLNVDDCFSNYISNNPDFLHFESPDIENICTRLKLLKVRFKTINIENANSDLFREVYHTYLYSLNKPMIWLILNKVYGIPESKDYICKNYSLICSKLDESLLKYINANIVHYFDLMIKWCDSKITDEVGAALDILNNKEIDEQRKTQYIKNLQTKLEDIKDVKEKKLWPTLFACSVAEYSKGNIFEYFFKSGNSMDETLTAFMNNELAPIQFNYDEIEKVFGSGSGGSFYAAIVQNKLLSNQIYHSILRGLNRGYKSFDFTGIPSEKIKILIALKILVMNAENLTFIRSNYPEDLLEFILSNFPEYAKIITADTFSIEELLNVLGRTEANDEDIIKLLLFTQEPISILGKPFSEHLKVYLLQHNLYVQDVPSLAKGYDSESGDLQSEIERYCHEQYRTLVTTNVPLAFGLLTRLLDRDEISAGDKISMLLNSLSDLDPDNVKACFVQLEMSDYAGLLEGRRPKIVKDSVADQILPALRDKGWITLKEEKAGDTSYYHAIGRKQTKS